MYQISQKVHSHNNNSRQAKPTLSVYFMKKTQTVKMIYEFKMLSVLCRTY